MKEAVRADRRPRAAPHAGRTASTAATGRSRSSAAAAAGLITPGRLLAQEAISVAGIYTVPVEQQWVSRIHVAAEAAKAAGQITYTFSESIYAEVEHPVERLGRQNAHNRAFGEVRRRRLGVSGGRGHGLSVPQTRTTSNRSQPMKFFVDTADVDAIRELNELGMVDGVTTNPSLIMKSGRDIKEVTKEICEMVDGPVSAETVALDADGRVFEVLDQAGQARQKRGDHGLKDVRHTGHDMDILQRKARRGRDRSHFAAGGAIDLELWVGLEAGIPQWGNGSLDWQRPLLRK